MYKIDKLDREIANLLVEDGRASAAQIARRIGGVSERAVRYRIGRLVEEGVIQICAVPNPQRLGFTVVADVLVEVEPSSIRAVAQRLAAETCVTYVAFSIGESDVSVQVVARSNAEIYDFATGVIGRLPGVRKTTTTIVPVVLKDVFQWRIPETACSDGWDGSPA